VTAQVRKLTGLPCVIDNDANMAAWGAYDFELKKKYANVVAVTLGTGVGGGFILNGEMFRGSTGAAAEIGHMILRLGGAKCACGNRGCLEAYAGRYGLINHARTAYGKAGRELPPDATPQWLYEAAEKGDKVALELWEKMGEYLGEGLGNICVLLSPDVLILTGGLSRAKDYFLPAMKRVFASWRMNTAFEHMKIKVSRSPNLGSIGAAMYAQHHFGRKK
jgi:glucokinase